MANRYVCNLIIPGAAKSGTSSLHQYLGAHPEIAMSDSKEPHHFCKPALYASGADTHNAMFGLKPDAIYFGESSTGYLPWRPAVERIKRDLEATKIIMLLRHPVERCFSHYRWRYRLGLEKRPFMNALKADGFGYDPEKPSSYGYMAYLEFSKYSKQCPMWLDTFGEENCLLLNSSDLRRDHNGTMAKCFAFLDVRDFFSESTSEENQTNELERQPPVIVTKAMGLFPKYIKQSQTYKHLRQTVLRAIAPEPPSCMTTSERNFVEDALAEDITWFDSQFFAKNNIH